MNLIHTDEIFIWGVLRGKTQLRGIPHYSQCWREYRLKNTTVTEREKD